MPPSYLHCTVGTDDVAVQHRHMVKDFAVNYLKKLLRKAQVRKHAKLVLDGQEFCITVKTNGQNLALMLWIGTWRNRVPVMSTGVCIDPLAGKSLWHKLHTGEMMQGELAPQAPSDPWIVDRLEIGAVANPWVTLWTGDFSRCAAWAWAEMNQKARK